MVSIWAHEVWWLAESQQTLSSNVCVRRFLYASLMWWNISLCRDINTFFSLATYVNLSWHYIVPCLQLVIIIVFSTHTRTRQRERGRERRDTPFLSRTKMNVLWWRHNLLINKTHIDEFCLFLIFYPFVRFIFMFSHSPEAIKSRWMLKACLQRVIVDNIVVMDLFGTKL